MSTNYKVSLLRLSGLDLQRVNELGALHFKLHPNDFKHLSVAKQKEYLRDPNLKVVVARASKGVLMGMVVGMGTVSLLPRFRSRECQIHDIVVHDDHEGQGLATEITRQLIAIAFDQFKADVITLTSRDEREGAIRIYEKLGFQRKPNKTNTFTLKRNG